MTESQAPQPAPRPMPGQVWRYPGHSADTHYVLLGKDATGIWATAAFCWDATYGEFLKARNMLFSDSDLADATFVGRLPLNKAIPAHGEINERATFEAELRRQCFQEPPTEARDLAWSMWKARAALAIPAPEGADAPLVVKTAPARIWLQVSDDADHNDKPFPASTHGDEVTWCQDKVLDCEVGYIRADLAAELQEVVRITIGNVRSLGPAGALAPVHTPYREWLAQLEAAYTKVTGEQA